MAEPQLWAEQSGPDIRSQQLPGPALLFEHPWQSRRAADTGGIQILAPSTCLKQLCPKLGGEGDQEAKDGHVQAGAQPLSTGHRGAKS